MPSFGNGRRSALAPPALVTAAVLFTAACGEDPDTDDYEYRTQDPTDQAQEQSIYCTTADGEIVSEDLCDPALDGDDDHNHYGGSHFILIGNYGSYGSHRIGERLPVTSGTRIHPGDAAARNRVGLPSSGRVSAPAAPRAGAPAPAPGVAPAPDPGRAAPAPNPGTRVQGGIGSGPQGGKSGGGTSAGS